MLNHRGSTVLVIIVGVLIIAIVGIIVSFTTKPTNIQKPTSSNQITALHSNLNTPPASNVANICDSNNPYINKQFGIQVNCPISFIVSGPDQYDSDLVGFSSKELHPTSAKNFSDIVIDRYPYSQLSNGGTLSGFVSQYSNGSYSVKNTSSYKNNYISGVVYTGDPNQKIVFVQNQNISYFYAFILQGPSSEKYSQKADEVFQTMLSTFKFTN